jgi:hypothetical protein
LDAVLQDGTGTPTAVLYSAKSTISLVYRSIAYAFKDRLNCTFVPIKSALAQHHGVTEPTRGGSGADGGAAQGYDGADMTSRSALVAWLTGLAKPAPAAASGDGSGSSDGGDSLFKGTEAVIGPDQELDAVPTDEAWLVAVVDAKGTRPETWDAALKGCAGKIKCVVLVCGAEAAEAPDAASGKKATFGRTACQGATSRYVVIRHGAPARKKLREDTVDKWGSAVYDASDLKKALKSLGDSLPDTAVRPVSEYNMWQFVTQNTQNGLVSILLVSNSDTIPPLFRNLALSVGEQAALGFMSMPSSDFVKAIGNKLPAVVAIPSPDPKEAESKGVQIINYNPELLGPFSYHGLFHFVEGVYKAFAHTFPVPDRPANARTRGAPREPEPEPEPPVDEGPIIADSEESIQEANDFLLEIQREEEERAARLKQEIEDEKKRQLDEEAAAKKKRKKKKKGKGKKSKSGGGEL